MQRFSVVDYLIMSSKLFPLIVKFEIDDFLPLYSDCHCAIRFEFKANVYNNTPLVTYIKRAQGFIRSNNEKKLAYADRIHNDPDGTLVGILSKLDEISLNHNVTQNEINSIVLNINDNIKAIVVVQ